MNILTEPDFTSAVLITIDTQRDTLDGQPMEVPGTSTVLPNISRLLHVFRALERPVIHMVRIYEPDGSNVDICRRDDVEKGRAILLTDSDGSQIASSLLLPETRLDSRRLLSGRVQAISDHEVIIYKPRWGAFFGTPLQKHLESVTASTLIFTGCNFPNCPRTSIYQASERDYRIVMVTDAISGRRVSRAGCNMCRWSGGCFPAAGSRRLCRASRGPRRLPFPAARLH